MTFTDQVSCCSRHCRPSKKLPRLCRKVRDFAAAAAAGCRSPILPCTMQERQIANCETCSTRMYVDHGAICCPASTTPLLTNCPVRTKRVREARDEARKEIEEYKAQKEAEFKNFEAEVSPPCSAQTPVQKCLTLAAHPRKQGRRGGGQPRGPDQDQGDQGGRQEEPGQGDQRPAGGRAQRQPRAAVQGMSQVEERGRNVIREERREKKPDVCFVDACRN